jgi:hypothetical protein
MKSFLMASALVVGLAVAGCAHKGEEAKGPSFAATLAPGTGINSTGKGKAEFKLDPATKVLTYTVTYEGLTGPAMAAHIHGPADPGANAGVVVPFAAPASPITGTATLTDAQVAELEAGKYYVNVHTDAFKGGEIRGQITKK